MYVDPRVYTHIPHGNACDVEIGPGEEAIEVRFAADPRGGPEALWFCFRVHIEARGEDDRLTLVLRNPDTLLGGTPATRMRPVVRHGTGEWGRLGTGELQVLPDGRLEVAWTVVPEAAYFDMAYCYPYGAAELSQLIRDTEPFYAVDSIGVSQGGRPLLRLSNQYGSQGSTRPGLYLIARQHAGETPGSWVLDGFLRAMAEAPEVAPLLWAVPFADTDGVEQGDYGKDAFPYDLNRAWSTPPMRHEAVVIGADIRHWQDRCEPALLMDLHAPGGCENDGIYAFLPQSSEIEEYCKATDFWAATMGRALGSDFAAPDFARQATYPSRWPTPTLSAFCCLNDIPGFTLEVPYALIGDRVLSREDYQEAGRRMAHGVIDALRG